MSMSPRTQQLQMGAGAGVDQATALFEQGFSEMSYNVLLNKLPDIVQDVVTFKILETDIDHGMGMGAFVLLRHDQPLYIPVVMSENNVKPLELAYHKALNIFLPLTKQWLDEMDKTALSSLGKGVKTPDTLYSDVDIRNIAVPPMTGRFSYAQWEPVILADVAKVFTKESLEKLASEPALVLLEFLTKAPNGIKLAFTKVLEKNPRVFKYAASVYGVEPLIGALRQTVVKTAAKQNFGGALWIADKDTTPTEFRRVFGSNAGEAYAGVKTKGFAVRDDRKQHNTAVQVQNYQHLVEPRQPGIYVLFEADTAERPAFVMPNPIDLFAEGNRYAPRPVVYGKLPPASRTPPGRPNDEEFHRNQWTPMFFAVFANGDYLQNEHLVGQSTIADELSHDNVHRTIFKDLAGSPKQGLGFFVRQHGTTYQATSPLEIKTITTDSEGVRRIKACSPGGYQEKSIITQNGSSIWVPKCSDVVGLPADFAWVPLKTKLNKSDILTCANDLSRRTNSALVAAGARKVTFKSAGADQFSADGGRALSRIPMLKQAALVLELPVPTVEMLLAKAASDRRVEFWVASIEKLARAQMILNKTAWHPGKKKETKEPKEPAEEGPDPATDAGADPSADPMAGGDPSMDPAMAQMAMQPPAPPPPNPSDLAAMEMQQQIDQEMQHLQEKAQMLAALTQRTQEIASGAPVAPTVQTQAMGAPPPSMNMATGAPMPPPGGMDPSMMGGAPPPGAGGMNPSMMGGAPPPGAGMDPSMMGGPPLGMDPSMMAAGPGGALPADPSMMGGPPSMGGGAPAPGAMMGIDGPSAQGIESEINPQFLQQAAQLQSGDVFDAAAVSSLAQSPAVKELVGQYLPNLEKALDNLGRVLLSLWMQEPSLKEEIGEATFSDLEDNLRSTFKNLGDLVLKLSQSAHAIKSQFEHAVT